MKRVVLFSLIICQSFCYLLGQNTSKGTLDIGNKKQNTGTGTLNVGNTIIETKKIKDKNIASGSLNLLDSKSIIEDVEEYVNKSIQDWLQKGRYEKTADYQQRVTEENKKIQIDKLTQEKVNEIANGIIKFSVTGNDYDADNEVFRLDFESLLPIYIKVPIDGGQAESFDKNLSGLKFEKPRYTLTPAEDFALMGINVINPVNGKTYVYNSSQPISYKETKVSANFYAVKIKVKADLDPSTAINISKETITSTISGVDRDIPESLIKKTNSFALIIGNEDYHSYQDGLNQEADVQYAENDARIFRGYCIKTLGIPEENATLIINGRMMTMNREIERICKIGKALGNEAEIIFYYAGHGLPDEQTKEAHLIPVDVSGNDLQFAIELKDIYRKFSDISAKKVTFFIDACFSGGSRNQGLLATRGIKIVPKANDNLTGNIVVFTASSGEQSSLPYNETGHGMFTYHLLKKIQETKGAITYGELSDYLQKQVSIKSIQINNKEQVPQTNISGSLINSWKDIPLN
jgi:hypothetical protein